MVVSTAKRVLHSEDDAEDAFQAACMVLAQKASSIGKRESVAAWLHKVAYRVAVRARTDLAHGTSTNRVRWATGRETL